MALTYHEKTTLARRGPVDPAPDEEVDGILLVATDAVASWWEGQTPYGADFVAVWPAIYRGQRAWVLRRTWMPTLGYSASGAEEEILDFEAGVRLVAEHGAWDQVFAAIEEAKR